MRKTHSVIACVLFCVCFQASATEFRARDFGATPDDSTDDTQAIRAALRAAAESDTPAEVVLDAGVYRLSQQDDHDEGALPLYDLRDVTLRGEPDLTQLRVMTYKLPALVLRNCRDVRVADLSIDYDPLPFTQGHETAVSREEGWFEYMPMSEYPGPDWAELSPGVGFGMLMDIGKRCPKGYGEAMFLDRWEPREAGVWRVYLRGDGRAQLDAFAVGDGYVHLARDGFAALGVINSEDCLLEGVTIHSSAALSFALMSNEGRITLRRCAVRFPAESDRWITTNGDGVHCQNNRVGPTIEDCYFEGMADDGVNIYATPMWVRATSAPDRIVLPSGSLVREGDLLQVFNPADGTVRGTVRAIRVASNEADETSVQMERSIPGIEHGNDADPSDCVFNLDACGAGYIIRRNTFATHRGRGLVLRATYGGVVEGNTFDNPCATYCVSIANEPSWPEGPFPVGNLTIRGNRFEHAGTAGIAAFGFGLGGFSTTPIGSYVIEGNTFSGVRGPAIHLGRVDHAVVRGNTFTDCATPLATDHWDRIETDASPGSQGR